MTDRDILVSNVIAAAGGRLVGRVRLQKVFYLLEQLGLGAELPYEYHHYGPYSAELSAAVADATAFRLIDERFDRRSDGVQFSIYSTKDKVSEQLGGLDIDDAQAALSRMQQCTSTVLELAATIHWLAEVERVPDWRAELRRRKGVKAEAGRTEAALSLLRDCGLAVA